MKIIIPLLLFYIYYLAGNVFGQNDYGHYQNSDTRALSLACSFTAVQDYHNSLNWNPAALVLAKGRTRLSSEQYFKANFDLGTLGLAFAGLIVQGIEQSSKDSTAEETDSEQESITFWEVMGLFIYSFRGITFIDRDNFLISLILHEDIMDYDTDITHILDNSYQSLVFSHMIGHEFSVGAALNYYQVHDNSIRKKGMGGNIGVQYNSVKYKGLTYGLSYFTFTKQVSDIRYRVERIYNNSIHLGLSYDLKNSFLFAMDLKNLTAFKKKYFCEAHFGFEQKVVGYFFLREGFFCWENSISKFVGSFGFGYRTKLFKSRKEDNLDLSLGGLFNCPQRNWNNRISYRNDMSITLRYSF